MKTFFLFLFLLPTLCFAQRELIELSGHLDQSKIEAVKKKIEATEEEGAKELFFMINSTSGELDAVFDLAKQVYRFKQNNGHTVTLYINDSALGPAALLPLLADELYSSSFVSWGDVLLGSRESVPVNILRSRVISLISDEAGKTELLKVIASAMVDPKFQVVEGNGLTLLPAKERTALEIISSSGETLVLNREQMQSLELLKEALPLKQWQERFFPKEDTPKIVSKPLAEKEVLSLSLQERLKKKIHFKTEAPNQVGRIVIDDRKAGINQSTWLYVKSALDHYKETKPAFIILELNTPGGEVYASQLIANALQEMDTQYHIPIVAYIDNWAISAGALLAYSCRFITIVPDASMGAAEPVMLGEGGAMKTAPEKINSALRAEFANRARFFGRNPLIAEAMVDKDIILVKRHGKLMKLDSEAEIRRGGLNADEVISAKGKLLTLDAVKLMELGVADLTVPTIALDPLTAQEKRQGSWPADKSPLFHVAFFDAIPKATIETYQMDWRTQFFVWLAMPVISSALFLGMMVGFYLEINTPGFGLPGSVALLCLVLIVMSSYALEIVSYLEIIFLLLGIGLLAIELFLIPSFGIVGIAGVVFLIVGVFGIMLPGIGQIDYEFDTQTFNAAGEVFFIRLGWLAATFALGVVIIALLGRYVMPSFAKFSRFVLQGQEQDATEGFFAGKDPKKLPQPGTKATVYATLRPSGKIDVNGTLYEAVAAGDFIEAGTEVVIVRLEGSVIVVE